MKLKIAILDDYSNVVRNVPQYALLADHDVTVFTEPVTDLAQIADQLKGFDAILLTQQRSRVSRSLLERLPRLKLISQTGANTSHIDVAACKDRGVVVAVGGHGSSQHTSELTWGLILAALRYLPYEVQRLKEGHWLSTVGTGLYGKTLGIYAYGKIGSRVAEVGRAFGMNVVCWGREGSLARAREAGFATAESRTAFFGQADVLCLHLRYSAETRGIVTAADLAAMKPAALLVNTSRSGLVDANVLLTALKAGRPGFAALDVFDTEPVLNAANPLLALDNVLCTPHLGYVTVDGLNRNYGAALEQIAAFAEGRAVKGS